MNHPDLERILRDEEATVGIARALGASLESGAVVFLKGQLGAGKTTFSRGVLRALGHEGAVKSPTFTLVEPYDLERLQVYHFDLYRLNDPNELEYMGVDDYFDSQHLCLVEWPERGEDFLPSSDLEVLLLVEGAERRLKIKANSENGERIIQRMNSELTE